VRLHLARGQALGDQRDHHFIDPAEAPLPLRHDPRLERGIPVAGHLHLHRADVGDHGLGPLPVPGVPAVPPGRVIAGIAQVSVHLTLQGALQHDLRQPAQQPARPGQRQPLRPRPLGELPDHLLIRRIHPAIIARTWRHARALLCNRRHGETSSDGSSVRPVTGVTPLFLQSSC
jgi:hypothetical protein